MADQNVREHRARRALLLALAAVVVPATATLLALRMDLPEGKKRIYVVAIRDSDFLTVCPIFGKDVQEGTAIRTDRQARPSVVVGFTPRPSMIVDFETEPRRRAILPVPPSLKDHVPALMPPAQGTELERVAFDPDVRTTVEQSLGHDKTVALADSVEQADFVFFIESSYTARTVATVANTRDPGDSRRDSPERISDDAERQSRALEDRRWPDPGRWVDESGSSAPRPPQTYPAVSTMATTSGDRKANWRQAAIAVVMPAEAYRRRPADAAALVAASVWSDFSLETRILKRGSAQVTSVAASPAELVKQYLQKKRTPPYLPVCAASSRVGENADTVSTPSATMPTETKEPPTATPAGAGVFRSQVTAVTVPFTVTGANQVPLLDLASAECHVLEDGVEQKIAGFAQSDAPSHVAIVLDTSGSMAWTVLRLRDTIDEVLRAMRPQDPLMLLTFDEHIRIQAEFTTDRTRVHDSIAGIARSWGTRLYDAIDLAVHDRMNQVEGRKAVVLLTDGLDTRSRLADGPTTLADVQAANIAVYVIRYAPSYDMVPTWLSTHTNAERLILVADDAQRAPSGTDPIGEYLQALCRATGGRQYVVQDILALQPAFREVAAELSHQYTLYYYPSNTRRDGTVRRITMAIDRIGAVVHARTAYRAASR